MTFQGYTKRDTNTLKGVAILCIVFHNYFHWLWPSPGENEFDFAPDRIRHFFDLLGQQPSEFVNILFSYFGHYGVQIFLFISGFGLAVSMMQRPRSWESFVVHRLKKLYPLLLTAILTYILVLLATEHRMLGAYEKQELGYKLLFLHTLIPDSGLSVNGPWWFFGLIFYLYLLFPWLYRWIQQWGYKVFFHYLYCFIYYNIFISSWFDLVSRQRGDDESTGASAGVLPRHPAGLFPRQTPPSSLVLPRPRGVLPRQLLRPVLSFHLSCFHCPRGLRHAKEVSG